MSTGLKPFLMRTSGALAVAAIALSLTFGGSAAHAEEPQSVFVQGQEMALVPVKSIEALEKRIAYLEETVNTLTEAWQHIDTHRICVSDPKGESETCLTKTQLDALIAAQPPVAQAAAEPAAAPAPAVAEAAPPAAEPAESVAKAEAAEPVPAEVARQDEPEHIGAIAPAAPAEAAAVIAQPPAIEPAESVAAVETAAPAPVEAASKEGQEELEQTGSIKPAASPAQPKEEAVTPDE